MILMGLSSFNFTLKLYISKLHVFLLSLPSLALLSYFYPVFEIRL
jgi:hypothetical protein